MRCKREAMKQSPPPLTPARWDQLETALLRFLTLAMRISLLDRGAVAHYSLNRQGPTCHFGISSHLPVMSTVGDTQLPFTAIRCRNRSCSRWPDTRAPRVERGRRRPSGDPFNSIRRTAKTPLQPDGHCRRDRSSGLTHEAKATPHRLIRQALGRFAGATRRRQPAILRNTTGDRNRASAICSPQFRIATTCGRAEVISAMRHLVTARDIAAWRQRWPTAASTPYRRTGLSAYPIR